ncbi:MAG: HAMP domain-containing histidine kinase [Desulfobacterales bacterium]|nr:HAMP domain-containing histidine kinase [Desulfobacterales bacterium]
MKTDYAAPERATDDQLQADINDIRTLDLVRELTEIIPDAFVILNIYRQIVYCNPTLLTLLSLSGPDPILGKRPGEALNCVHAKEIEDGGCGTSKHCKYCGAVNAILNSQDTPGEVQTKECRLVAGAQSQAFDFSVRAKTLSLFDRHFTLLIVQDISAEKRRTVMERIFFHDILNTAGGIQGLVELMQEATPEELDEFLNLAEASTITLVEEIHAQRDILAAEQGRLHLDTHHLNAADLLNQVMATYKKHPIADGKSIFIQPGAASTDFLSDPRLLTRIIGNMVKNALEAESPDAIITMGADVQDNEIEFWVQNPCVMSEEARMQIFQRSFSTKGKGRGLGTYSIKLLGETYLGGNVGFASEEPDGTRFHIRLPLGI